MRISGWSSDVCSSDLVPDVRRGLQVVEPGQRLGGGLPAVRADGGGDQRAVVVRAAQGGGMNRPFATAVVNGLLVALAVLSLAPLLWMLSVSFMQTGEAAHFPPPLLPSAATLDNYRELRSEEHTSDLQSLMRISYAVFCLNKKRTETHYT